MRGLDHLRPWLVPAYFTLGGLAGGLLLQGSIVDLSGSSPHRDLPVLRDVLVTPLLMLCGLVLTLDLTHPFRFYRLLLTFRPSSAVSWGTWILTGSGFTAALLALSRFVRPGGHGVPPWGSPLTEGCASILGVGLASYTGVLLTAAARRRWNATDHLGGIFLMQGNALAALGTLPWALPAARPGRALLGAMLLLGATLLLRIHLARLVVDAASGRTDADVPQGSALWLRRLAPATVVTLLAAVGVAWGADLGGVLPVFCAVTALLADASLRTAVFWLEEAPGAHLSGS